MGLACSFLWIHSSVRYFHNVYVKSSHQEFRKFFDIINTMPNVISLGVGEPDFVTPDHIRQAGISSIREGRTRYTSNYGLLELREEIAKTIEQRYGLNYDPTKQILITVGVSEGVDLAMRTIIDPGDEVISPDPGYVAYEADIIFLGGVPVPVPTYAQYDFGVRANDIAAVITPRTKMILIGDPNNPTGGCGSPCRTGRDRKTGSGA